MLSPYPSPFPEGSKATLVHYEQAVWFKQIFVCLGGEHRIKHSCCLFQLCVQLLAEGLCLKHAILIFAGGALCTNVFPWLIIGFL